MRFLPALLLTVAGCDLLSPVARDHSTSKGDASHLETDTTVDAGRDARVSNWTFNGGGYILGALAGIGWFIAHRGARQNCTALDTVIVAIEENQCADCKTCVARRMNAVVNARVRQITKNGLKA